jgi:hypothetical protein
MMQIEKIAEMLEIHSMVILFHSIAVDTSNHERNSRPHVLFYDAGLDMV